MESKFVALLLGAALCLPMGGCGSKEWKLAVDPKSGQGASGVFRARFDSGSDAEISEARILFSPAVDGRNACYVFYNPAVNFFYLASDQGSGSTKVAAGTSESAENSQCTLQGQSSTAKKDGHGIEVQMMVAFKPAFKGQQNIYLYAAAADQNSGLQPRGEWLVRSE